MALNKGQRVQEIGYLVGILASKANGMMDLDCRWLALCGRKLSTRHSQGEFS